MVNHIVTLERAPSRTHIAAFPEGVATAFENLFGVHATDSTELIFVNHGEPEDCAALRNGTRADPPLSEKCRCQAMRAAMRLRSEKIDAIYSSTARVALETAVLIAAAKDLPMRRTPQLREVEFHGDAENELSDVQKTAAEALVRFINKPRWDGLRGFEPSRQFRHRVVLAIEGILANNPGRRVVVVTHQGVINAYFSMVLDIGRDMFFLPRHASISELRFHGDLYALNSLNDVAHLMPTFNPS